MKKLLLAVLLVFCMAGISHAEDLEALEDIIEQLALCGCKGTLVYEYEDGYSSGRSTTITITFNGDGKAAGIIHERGKAKAKGWVRKKKKVMVIPLPGGKKVRFCLHGGKITEEIADKIKKIEGVEFVWGYSLTAHEIIIEKAKCYTWDEVEPKIIEVLER